MTPKAPYIEWANTTDLDGPCYEDLARDPDTQTVFLGPDVYAVDEATAFVKENFDLFFEHHLESWCTDPASWPPNRSYSMFEAWFSVAIHSLVIDTVDAPLELE